MNKSIDKSGCTKVDRTPIYQHVLAEGGCGRTVDMLELLPDVALGEFAFLLADVLQDGARAWGAMPYPALSQALLELPEPARNEIVYFVLQIMVRTSDPVFANTLSVLRAHAFAQRGN